MLFSCAAFGKEGVLCWCR